VDGSSAYLEQSVEDRLEQRHQEVISHIAQKNAEFFDTELGKLEEWADDLKAGLELEIKNLDKEIRLRKNESRTLIQLERS